MAVKSIIDIDVNTQQFKDFVALFQTWQSQAVQMPGVMNATATAAAGTATATGAASTATSGVLSQSELVTAALLYQTELLREQVAEQGKLDRQAAQAARERAADAKERLDAAKQIAKVERERHEANLKSYEYTKRFWSEQATLTGSIVRNVAGIAKTVVGLGVTGVFGALVGGGLGLFGLDAMAHGVSERRLSAQGLGITSGEEQAFQTNFGTRLGLGSDFIGRVQDTQSDISKSWQFDQLGLPRGAAQSMDHAQLSAEVIKRAKTLWDQAGPQGHNQQWMGAHGLSGLMNFSQWQTIGAQDAGDVGRYADQYVRDSKGLDVSDPDQKAWQDLSVQLHRAGREIENVFVKGLVPLTGPLGELSHEVASALQTFLANPQLKTWIKELSDAIHDFATYMGTKEFKESVKEFSNDVMDFGKSVVQLLPDLKDTLTVVAAIGRGLGIILGPSLHGPGDHGVMQYDLDHPENGVTPDTIAPKGARPWYNGGVGDWVTKHLGMSASASEVPPASLMSAIGGIESGNTDHPRDTFDGKPGQWHRGRYQMSDDMLARYGVTNPYDPAQVTPAATKEEGKYLSRFNGNVAQAVAAWNEGPGAVERQIREACADADHTGRDWLHRASGPVQRYVQHAAQRMKVEVSVINQTGAQIAVLANAVHQ